MARTALHKVPPENFETSYRPLTQMGRMFLANQKSKSGLADCRGFSASLHLRRVIHPWVSKYVVTKPYVVEHSCTCINVCRAVQAVHHRHIYGHGCKSNSTIAESVLSVNCSLFLRYGEVPYMTVKIQP